MWIAAMAFGALAVLTGALAASGVCLLVLRHYVYRPAQQALQTVRESEPTDGIPLEKQLFNLFNYDGTEQKSKEDA